MKLLRFIPDHTNFGFMRFRRVSFPFSALASIVAVVAFLTLGMNVGIDFKGGTVVEMQAKAEKADAHAIREAAHKLVVGEVEVQVGTETARVGVPWPVRLGIGLSFHVPIEPVY